LEWLTLLPATGPFPQISHLLAIVFILPCRSGCAADMQTKILVPAARTVNREKVIAGSG